MMEEWLFDSFNRPKSKAMLIKNGCKALFESVLLRTTRGILSYKLLFLETTWLQLNLN